MIVIDKAATVNVDYRICVTGVCICVFPMYLFQFPCVLENVHNLM